METFKFLNRNLNFVPNQSKINKKELYNQVEERYIVALNKNPIYKTSENMQTYPMKNIDL